MNTDKPMMASEIVSALSNPSRGIYGYQNGKYAKAMARSVQSDLASSQKFIISNNLIDHIVAMSFSTPEAMVGQIKTGIPPFTNMFIEWDDEYLQKAVIKYLAKNYNKKLASAPTVNKDNYFNYDNTEKPFKARTGYHIHQVNDNWLYELWWKDKENEQKFTCTPKSISINHDAVYNWQKYYEGYHKEKKWMPVELNGLSEENLRIAMYSTGSILWGNHYHIIQSYGERFRRLVRSSTHRDKTPIISQNKYYRKKLKTYFKTEESTSKFFDPYFTELCCRVTLAQGSAMHWMVPQEKFKLGWTANEMTELTQTCMRIYTGDVRFLVSTLAILNYEHIITEKKKPDSTKVKHIAFGRRVPANEYSLLEIDLPKPRGKIFYEREFTGHGTPKRWHMRRGHWRRYRDAKGNVTKRVWIDQCEAGSKDLGTKIKDYNLQKARGE